MKSTGIRTTWISRFNFLLLIKYFKKIVNLLNKYDNNQNRVYVKNKMFDKNGTMAVREK